MLATMMKDKYKKTELKLYKVVTGIVFRALFYGIVQPEVFLSCRSSFLLFFPCRGSIAISSCLCMKMAWASFYSFGTMTFFLSRITTKKAEKLKTCHKHGFTLVIYCMQNCALFATATPTPKTWIRSFTVVGLVMPILIQHTQQDTAFHAPY